MNDAALRTPGLTVRALEPQVPAPARTALTAFVGVTKRGPLDSPQIVGSFGDFVTVFGDVWWCGTVGASVYGFFLNGGEEAVIVRVARPAPIAAPAAGTCASKADLATATPTSAIFDANGAETLALAPRNPGSWGNDLLVKVEADAARAMDLGKLTATAAGGATDVVVDCVYDYRPSGTIRLVHAVNPFLKSTHQVTGIDEATRRLTVSPPLPVGGYPAGSTVAGTGFRLTVTDGARVEVFDGLSMNRAHPRYFVDAVNGPENLPYLELGRQGASLLVVARQLFGPSGQSRFRPATPAAPIAFAGGADGLTFATATLEDAGAAASVLVTARVGGMAGQGVRVEAAPFAGRLALAVPPASGGAKDRLFVEDVEGWLAGDTVTITHATNPAVTETAPIASVDPATHEVHLGATLVNDYPLASGVTVAGRFDLTITPPPEPLPGGPRFRGEPAVPARDARTFRNLSMAPGPRLFTTIVDGTAGSPWICVSPAPGAVAPPVGRVELAGASDPDEVPLPYFTGYADDGTLFQPAGATGPVGLASLEAVPAVNLVTVSDLVGRADLLPADRLRGQTQALFHCQKMGERLALLDVPRSLPRDQVLEWPDHFTDGRLARFGALYHPWVGLALPSGGDGASGDRFVPPSGVMAGLFARVDRQGGVGQAPANVQLKGAVSLSDDVDADAQGPLNDAGVNCVRKFEVGAVRLWGARTLSRDDQYLYVHNRRVVLLVIKGLTSGLRWAVFEPNGPALQRRVKAAIEGFLRGIFARGLSSGGTAADAFFVNVGDDLNTPATRDLGQLIAEVGVAVAKPAEFIVITVKRTPDILSLVEEEA